MPTGEAWLASIERTVNGGKSVANADNSTLVSMIQEALENGRSATFYVSPNCREHRNALVLGGEVASVGAFRGGGEAEQELRAEVGR
jgi:hypothetical protein